MGPATRETELGRQLDEVLALLDVAVSREIRQVLLARKATIERRIFDEYAAPRPRARCEPETWATIAAAIRQRDGHMCGMCGAEKVRLNVHHLVAVEYGGGDNPENLLTLCDDCHATIHPWLGGRDGE